MKKQYSPLHFIAGGLFAVLALSAVLSTFRSIQISGFNTNMIISLLNSAACILLAVGLFTNTGLLFAAGGIIGMLQALAFPMIQLIALDPVSTMPGDIILMVLPLVISAIPGFLQNLLLMISGFARKAAKILCIICGVLIILNAVTSAVSILAAAGGALSLVSILKSTVLTGVVRAVAVVLAGFALSYVPKAEEAAPAEL